MSSTTSTDFKTTYWPSGKRRYHGRRNNSAQRDTTTSNKSKKTTNPNWFGAAVAKITNNASALPSYPFPPNLTNVVATHVSKATDRRQKALKAIRDATGSAIYDATMTSFAQGPAKEGTISYRHNIEAMVQVLLKSCNMPLTTDLENLHLNPKSKDLMLYNLTKTTFPSTFQIHFDQFVRDVCVPKMAELCRHQTTNKNNRNIIMKKKMFLNKNSARQNKGRYYEEENGDIWYSNGQGWVKCSADVGGILSLAAAQQYFLTLKKTNKKETAADKNEQSDSNSYDFDNYSTRLSIEDLTELIEVNKQKEIDKVIHNWEDVGIRVEKAKRGRFNVLKGKIKIELPKTTNIEKLSKEDAIQMVEAKALNHWSTKKKTPDKNEQSDSKSSNASVGSKIIMIATQKHLPCGARATIMEDKNRTQWLVYVTNGSDLPLEPFTSVGGRRTIQKSQEGQKWKIVSPLDASDSKTSSDASVDTMYYQAFPCLRIVRPDEFSIGPHADVSYGHHPCNVNFYIPLTSIQGTSSLYLESNINQEDWHPIQGQAGDIVHFAGATNLHWTTENKTSKTRVSLDVRVISSIDYHALKDGGDREGGQIDVYRRDPGYYQKCVLDADNKWQRVGPLLPPDARVGYPWTIKNWYKILPELFTKGNAKGK